MADCRLCVYFVPFEKLDDRLKEKVAVQAAKRGEKPLGWCGYDGHQHVVTYYEGKCRYFTRKPYKIINLYGTEVIIYR